MIQPIAAISASDIVARAATPAPDVQTLAQRFDQLMALPDAGASVVVPPTSAPGAAPISSAITALADADRQLGKDMANFSVLSPSMNMQELTAMQMQLTLRTAVTGAQMTLTTALLQSGKGSLNTLMKNQ